MMMYYCEWYIVENARAYIIILTSRDASSRAPPPIRRFLSFLANALSCSTDFFKADLTYTQ